MAGHMTLINEISENVDHHHLEGSQAVSEAKEHNQGFKKASIHPEGSFPLISLFDFVTFHNTHSIFADIIQAEILEPDLSNSISNSLHNFTHFHVLPTIPTFLEPLVPVPRTILQPCLQLLCSITLTLIVSNCLLSSHQEL